MFATGTPTVVVTLGGHEYELGFTLGAMRRIKGRLGTLELSLGEEAGDEGVLALPVYIWASMDKEGREALSVEDVEEMIHPNNMVEISEAMATLFIQSAPEGAEGNAPTGKKVARK